ncbi:uncharacterized protein B0I36DRAFT_359516 [Microdochium trichocladiopsis]|uniref:Repetitive proline-rich cell wall protein n=1 Tax=Microdochium trichocladiopsis TaxID=1682393 RepID=A0A9P8YH72_9PEZI|nr:uncharacterized protein B0I36DRAFT_359516 [Microdochium trichocladiopsis]KAH7037883.1 hypothetical protein B0I36DRAFT_359516 [Microdochium trichocladiopsis]
MKYAAALVAMAGSVMAGYPHNGGYQATTTEVEVTYTTVCPATETVTYPGNTYATTYTTTSVYVTKIPTVIYETVHGPDVTKTEHDVEYTTVTSLCPVTETKTIAGETVVVTWTSTSTIEEALTKTDYVHYTVTEHTSTEVYETCPVTVYTTVSKGETIYITETGTETFYTTYEHVVTETIPVTQTAEVDVTVTHAATNGQTVTEYPTVYVTVSGVETVSQAPPPPVTVVQPTTVSTSVAITSTPAPASTSSIPVAAGAQATPAAALLMGVLGIAALL